MRSTTNQALRQRAGAVLSVLLLASLACSFPGRSQPTPTPSPSPTPAPTQTAPVQGGKPYYDETLPPVLVETDPPSGSRVAPRQAFIFYFSQPMERPSVESALGGEPRPSGSVEWLDNATLRFTPDQAYPPDIPIRFTLGAGARSAVGTAMQNDVTVSYVTAGPLRVADRLPKPGSADANPTSAVTVTFTDPVVPLGADPGSLPPAFSLEPAADGKGEWINTSTYSFFPDPALKGGTVYRVALNSELTSTYGGRLDPAAVSVSDWTFTTSNPRLLAIDTGEQDLLGLDQPVRLTFNQAIDPASAGQNIVLLDKNGIPVEVKREWDESGSILTLTPVELLRRNEPYRVQVGAFTTGLGGTPLGSDQNFDFISVGRLQVKSTNPAAGEKFFAGYGMGSFSIDFNAALESGQDFTALVEVQPAVADLLVFSTGEASLFVQGNFQPSTTYSVRLSDQIKDTWGGSLGEPVTLLFTSDDAQPSLLIPAAQTGGASLFVPLGTAAITARAANISRVSLNSAALDINTYITIAEGYGASPTDQVPPGSVVGWDVPVSIPANRNQEISLPLTPDGQAPGTGLYLFSTAAPEINFGSRDNRLYYTLVVSRLHLLVKHGADQATAWAVDLANRQPAAQLPVTFYNSKGEAIGQCNTSNQGVCTTNLTGQTDSYTSVYAGIGQPGDPNFAFASTGMAGGIGPWEFGVVSADSRSRPLLYLYTDRPIYRPGQEVFFRAVLRRQNDARYTLEDAKEIELQILPPYNYQIQQQQPLKILRLNLSPYGTVSGSFLLPVGAAPGYYTISSTNEDFPGSVTIQVAEYKKPEFELRVELDQKELTAGQPLRAAVSAAYYFGAPAGNLTVNWTISRRDDWLYLPGGWHTGSYDTGWLNYYYTEPGSYAYFFAQGTGVTAPDGSLSIDIPPDTLAKLDPRRRQILTVEVTAADESSLPVSARAETIFHPATFYAGVQPEAWGIQAGDELGFSVQTVDWTSQPSGNHALTARFSKVRWVRSDPPDGLGLPAYVKETTQVASTDFRTDGLGRARIAFTPPDPGVYEIEVSGSGAYTAMLVWVGGPGSAPWPNLPNQRLRLELDASSYQAGQTARLRFANPFNERALALVSIERARVITTQVIEVNGSMGEINLPVEAGYAPNVYAVVTLLGRTERGEPDFRQGYLRMDVDPAALRLNLAVEPSSERVAPGQELELTLRVTDSGGRPVRGEFSLALVDKAVLALADPLVPNLFDAFYGPQPLGVSTGLNLASYAGRFMPSAPGRGGGGGGDMMVNQVRENFKDTAFWSGTVETDADGRASVALRLPDNLTTWVADLRGLTLDTQIGEARIEVVTSKDLLIRPVTPRFLTAGDRVRLGAVVQNNTAETLTTTVSLQAPGLTLDASTPAAQNVEVAAGGRQRVNWWVTVEDGTAVDPLFSVEGGGLRDQTRVEGAPLKVLRYSAPQTFATGGVLAEGGERLEVIGLPRSFTPTGGQLRVELASSLAASVLQGLEALQTFPDESTEQIISRLLPNLAANRAVNQLGVRAPDLASRLNTEINAQLPRLLEAQRDDGGFGWNRGDGASQPYLSAYALLTLSEARRQGFLNNQAVFDRLNAYLFGSYFQPDNTTDAWQLDRLAFLAYAAADNLETSDPSVDMATEALYQRQEQLSPWARALLARTLQITAPGDNRAADLVSNIEAAAQRSATGASWDAPGPNWFNWSTPGFSTAVVAYVLATIDPAAPVLTDALRYLVLSRQPNGCWQSSYESAWVLLALSQGLTATGDMQADFSYSVELNGTPLAAGSPATPSSTLQPVTATAPLSDLFTDGPNALRILREAGAGRLYYRAFLEINRRAEEVPPLERGLALRREYIPAGQDCTTQACTPVEQVKLSPDQTLEVRLTLTVPQDMYFVSVEDTIPAGVEMINPNLKTSRTAVGAEPQESGPQFDLRAPFRGGYGWWFFGRAVMRDTGVSWTAPYLPAGTYQLTYRVMPVTAGEFRALPARAYQVYFPDIQGASAGAILRIGE